MKSEIAKYEILYDADCDICRGYFDTVYEFVYKTPQEGNVISIEKCRFCPECLENVKKEFGDDLGSV